MKSDLLSLYPAILVPILCEWGNDFELGRLDTAVCNSKVRPTLMSVLEKCYVSSICLSSDDKTTWLALRGIGLRNFRFAYGEKNENGLSNSLQLLFTKSTHLDMLQNFSFPLLMKILDICPCIRSLEFANGTSDEEFLIVATRVKNVENLDLMVSTKLTSGICDGIIQWFPNLKKISARFEICTLIDQCKELREITCRWSGETQHSIMQSRSLTSISFIGDSRISTCDTFLGIDVCSDLQRFFFEFDLFTDDFIIRMCNKCHQLRELFLGRLTSDESLMVVATDCPLLEHLTVMSGSDKGIMAIAQGCPVLTYLNANTHGLTDIGLLVILNCCKRLTSLIVFGAVTDWGLCRAFEDCPTLRYLEVSPGYEDEITGKVIASNARDMEELSWLNRTVRMNRRLHDSSAKLEVYFDFSVKVERSSLLLIFIQCPHLVKVSLGDLYCVNDECIETMVKQCPLLTDVSIDGYTAISASSVVTIIGNCHRLKRFSMTSTQTNSESMDLWGCEESPLQHLTMSAVDRDFSNELLLELVDRCPLLRYVSISATHLTSASICYLVAKCRQLTHLDVAGCTLLTTEVLKIFETLKRRMVYVNVSGCPLITEAEVRECADQIKEWVWKFNRTLEN